MTVRQLYLPEAVYLFFSLICMLLYVNFASYHKNRIIGAYGILQLLFYPAVNYYFVCKSSYHNCFNSIEHNLTCQQYNNCPVRSIYICFTKLKTRRQRRSSDEIYYYQGRDRCSDRLNLITHYILRHHSCPQPAVAIQYRRR
jgi:hypothetical protein